MRYYTDRRPRPLDFASLPSPRATIMAPQDKPDKLLSEAFTNYDTDKILELLQTSDVDINHRCEMHGQQTYLMRLCHLHIDSGERKVIMEGILWKNPDINAQDSSGRTALAHACIAERSDIVECLAETGECDPNIPDNDGNTPLIYAVRCRKVALIQTLLSSFRDTELDLNYVNRKGSCALTEAEEGCDGESIRALLREPSIDSSVLENIPLPKEVRSLRTPRSPTPDKLSLSRSPLAMRKNRSTTPRDLSPLVITPRVKMGDYPSQNYTCPTPSTASKAPPPRAASTEKFLRPDTVTTSTSTEYLLSDVQEEEEEIFFGEDPAETNCNVGLQRDHRKNSYSLPDLRDTAGSLVASTPSSTHSYNGCEEVFSRAERHSTLLDDTFVLPELSEREEEEDDYEMTPPITRRHKRKNSLSLPDISPSGVKENTQYQSNSNVPVSARRANRAESLGTGLNSDSMKLPMLNLNNHLSTSIPEQVGAKRNGFTGAYNNLRKVTTPRDKETLDIITPRRAEKLRQKDFQLNGARVNMTVVKAVTK